MYTKYVCAKDNLPTFVEIIWVRNAPERPTLIPCAPFRMVLLLIRTVFEIHNDYVKGMLVMGAPFFLTGWEHCVGGMTTINAIKNRWS